MTLPNIVDVFGEPTSTMLAFLDEQMKGLGYTVDANGKMFAYYPGTLPVMLVGHVDTAHFKSPPNKKNIFYDQDKYVYWSPDGLGADDRAGIWSMLWLLYQGHRPHVLFTDGEESGCIGASDAIKVFEPKGVHCLIELDRKNDQDCVFYMCENKQWQAWVETFGFKTAQGSCSDISVLMPDWDLAGVNLSIGYYDAHNKTEILRTDEMMATNRKALQMLANPPEKRIPGECRKYTHTYTWTSGQGSIVHGNGSLYEHGKSQLTHTTMGGPVYSGKKRGKPEWWWCKHCQKKCTYDGCITLETRNGHEVVACWECHFKLHKKPENYYKCKVCNIWIPITDRMPRPPDDECLVCYEKKCRQLGYFIE